MSPMAGDSLKPLRIACVSPEGMKSWAKFLRDPNPIHLDPKAVLAKGLGDRVINQGPANLAYVISMLQAALPGAHLETLDVRYVDNVFGGEAVEASGKVLEAHMQADTMRMTCEILLRVEGRGPVITGTAVLELAVVR
jgi:3-hydroxybutyryl-CoA dehydratase